MDNTVHHNSIYPPLLTFPKGQGGGQETIFTMRIITETTESTMIWLFLVLCVYLILTTIPVDLVHVERMAAYGPAVLSFLSSQGEGETYDAFPLLLSPFCKVHRDCVTRSNFF